MKAALVIVASAFVGACLLNGWYSNFGWHYFEMPFPDIIAPAFHLGGEAHYDAAETEVLVEFFIALLALFTSAYWVKRKFSS